MSFWTYCRAHQIDHLDDDGCPACNTQERCDRYRKALEVYAAMNYPFNEVAKQALDDTRGKQ